MTRCLRTCANCAHFEPKTEHPRSVGWCCAQLIDTSAISEICHRFEQKRCEKYPAGERDKQYQGGMRA
jgi:hypothetical protein